MGVRFSFPDEEKNAAEWAAWRGAHGLPETPAPPRYANTGEVALLTDPLAIVHRGYMYEVPPISYRHGMELDELMLRRSEVMAMEAGEEKIAARLKWFQQCAEFVFKVAFPAPRHWLLRLARRLGRMPNPFLTATEQELINHVAFLLGCRTIMPGQVSAPDPADASLTPETTSRISYTGIPGGLAPTGTL